ncbi:hypothetical protein F443_20544 [Plasmopara halstedii]|uniref:Uncharacterized protein n=1 Tax=Plasmopara halstedii TaxID=4781 RepID=A0A0N7L7U9_PLAHL|nr:hypothetical protein F443_20544 [Plasmopara halstedii]CEG48083.1 hypothetical protein F443_20544 [Plasmopara halstedii]|eukprot:XP_024584452.1 hypothetical protein F443_20544 [Plasmopara halstedii]
MNIENDEMSKASGMHLDLEEITSSDDVQAMKKVQSRKHKVRAQTIEEVFQTLSNFRSSDINPPHEHLVLTPRSAEVCLRCGVNPETLKLRDLDSFYNSEVTPAVQRMRHEAYSLRRHEEMEMLRREKMKLVNGIDQKVVPLKEESEHKSNSNGASMKRSSALLDLERQRLEKVRQRQERELEQMLEFEMKMNRLQQEAAEKMEREKRQHDAMERSKVRIAREVAADKRARELRKKAELEAEDERRKELTMQLATRDRTLAEEKARQEKLRRLEAREREEERKIKAEEHRVQTEKLLRAQQEEVQKRLHELEMAEKAREETVEKQRADRAIVMEARRRQVTQRIRKNLKMSKKLEAQRNEEIRRKQEASEAARKEREEEERRVRALQLEQQAEAERKRLLVLEESRREEARKKQEMIERQTETDRNIQQVQKHQEQQRAMRCEYRKLQAQLKMDKVERMKRMQEYQRLEMSRKLRDSEVRTQHLLDEKQLLVNCRKQLAIQTKIQRDLILRTMEKVKITKKWHHASKTIEKVLSGGKGIAGSRSSKVRPKSSSNVVGRQAFLPTLSSPTTPMTVNSTLSDGHSSNELNPPSPPPSQSAFKFIKTQNSAAEHAAQRYLSPYESIKKG